MTAKNSIGIVRKCSLQKYIITAVFSLFFTITSYGDELFYTANLGINVGGENVAIGDQTLPAGSGMTLKAGLLYRPFSMIEVQSTIGLEWYYRDYEADTDSDSDTDAEDMGDVISYKIPLECILFLRTEISESQAIRIGGGPVLQISPTITGNYDGDDVNLKADDTLGWIIALDFVFGEKVEYFIGINATFIDYEFSGNTSVSGNNINMHFGFNF